MNTRTFLVYQYCLKMRCLHSLDSTSVIQNLTILECKNGPLLFNYYTFSKESWCALKLSFYFAKFMFQHSINVFFFVFFLFFFLNVRDPLLEITLVAVGMIPSLRMTYLVIKGTKLITFFLFPNYCTVLITICNIIKQNESELPNINLR